jgi:hypothetical protein
VRRTAYAKTQREARAKLRNLQRQADADGGLPDGGRRTVTDLIDVWLTSASNLKATTKDQYRLFFDTYAREMLGNTRLANVTPDMLQRLYAGLISSVGKRVHALLHRAFAVAVMWRWLPFNPSDRVLKLTYKPSRKTLWTRAELDTFFDAMTDHWLHPLMRIDVQNQ